MYTDFLKRGGWSTATRKIDSETGDVKLSPDEKQNTSYLASFSKLLRNLRISLEIRVLKRWEVKGPRFRYVIRRTETREPLVSEGITWADFDGKKRLIFARDGKLFAASPDSNEFAPVELADFNANKPEQVIPPVWAKRW
jgi:hypothetical protein